MDEAERERRRAEIHKGWATVARTADVEVVHRSHHDDDALLAWRRNMPKPEPVLTAGKTAKMIAEQLAAYREIWLEVQAQAIAHERKLHRDAVAKVRTELRKLVLDDRTLARHELNRQRADHDRQRASMLAEIQQLRTKNAELELRLDSLQHETTKRAIDGRIIDLPAILPKGQRRA
jgi:hypothetical protein